MWKCTLPESGHEHVWNCGNLEIEEAGVWNKMWKCSLRDSRHRHGHKTWKLSKQVSGKPVLEIDIQMCNAKFGDHCVRCLETWKLSKQVSGSDQYVCCQASQPSSRQLHIAPEIQIKTQFWNQTPVSVTLQKRQKFKFQLYCSGISGNVDSVGLGLAWQQTYWSLPDTCFDNFQLSCRCLCLCL